MNGLRYDREIRWLFQAAMALFLVTIGIGMARGLGLIDFENRNNFLTHLHSGVIGWITLSIFASILWLYGGTGSRETDEGLVPPTTILLIVAVPLYVIAWWSGNLPFRAVAGAGVLLGIVLFVGWLVVAAWRIGYRSLTTPRLGAVLGLVSLVVGSTIGVLLQIQFATKADFLPESATGAHAETQISAYLVLVAMSIAYWRLHGNDRTARGTWMVWLFFIGGVTLRDRHTVRAGVPGGLHLPDCRLWDPAAVADLRGRTAQPDPLQRAPTLRGDGHQYDLWPPVRPEPRPALDLAVGRRHPLLGHEPRRGRVHRRASVRRPGDAGLDHPGAGAFAPVGARHPHAAPVGP